MCFITLKSSNRWLSLVQWLYNSNYHNAIKSRPFEAMFGYRPSLLPAISDSPPTMATVGHYLQQRQQILTVLVDVLPELICWKFRKIRRDCDDDWMAVRVQDTICN